MGAPRAVEKQARQQGNIAVLPFVDPWVKDRTAAFGPASDRVRVTADDRAGGRPFRHWRPDPIMQGCTRRNGSGAVETSMLTFVLWLLLLVFCWPLALLALVLYPIVWLLLLPFRLLGVAVEGVFELLKAIILLPARVLGGKPAT
jgi:type IV secretory pathway VirB3-like protein